MLRALARVNLAAIERNVARLHAGLGSGTGLCAVVKADGYGHGAVETGRAALAAGASWLAVATVGEALALRDAGVGAPLLILGAISTEELPLAVAARADVVAWSEPFLDALRGAAAGSPVIGVHVKLDTGMGRLGTREVGEALEVAVRTLEREPALRLAGVMTHFATADEDPEFMALQLQRFRPFVERLRRRAPGVIVHAANSAATLRSEEAHFDLVRCGIAIYGGDPWNEDPVARGLEPALELSSYVAAVKLARPGDSTGYGRGFIADRDTWIATLPIGYADGIRRSPGGGGEALIGGRRHPFAGTVSMDNVTIALGERPRARIGDRAILIGADGAERLTAEDLARRLGTINYEVLCAISARVPRHHHRDGAPVA
ncbi:MAG: alanine racemase [Solirubrobacteraceae bacterium]